MFFSFLSVITFMYGVRVFHIVVSFNPMAIHTSVSFLLLASAMLLSKPGKGLVKEVFSAEAGGYMARHLLPVIFICPVILGFLHLMGERTGVYENDISAATMVVAIIVIFGFVILNNAHLMNQAAEKRKEVERALEKISRRESAMIRNALDVICAIDEEGRFCSLSPASFKVWGYRPEELLGRKYMDLVAQV
jgi:PAS domain-containing protein